MGEDRYGMGSRLALAAAKSTERPRAGRVAAGPGSRAVARVCLGEVRLGKWADRGCAGSFAREAEFSKGCRHFASVITLAKCGIAVKAAASL